MNAKRLVSNVLQTKTIYHFFITSSGTVINGALGLLFYIIAARSLGPSSYGILAIAIAVVTVVADIADLGIDTGVIRLVGKYYSRDRDKALSVVKLGTGIKVIVWLVILSGGWILSPWIAEIIFHKVELMMFLRLAFIGVGGAMLFSLVSHTLQALQRYWLWSVLNISMNAVRLLAVLFLILTANFNPMSSLVFYIAVPFLGFCISLLLLPSYFKASFDREVTKELFNYSKWVALVGILTVLGSRLDTFISGRLLTTAQVGIYSAANQISIIVPQLVFALATVAAPKIAGLDTQQKVIKYLKKLQLLVLGIVILGIIMLPLLIYCIPLIFGQSYLDSIPPFIILFLAQLIFLLSLPSHQAIYYYFAKPGFFIWTAIIQLMITGIGGWFLISALGVIGAAVTILLSNIVNFIIPGVWVLHKFNTNGSIK